MVRKSGHSGSFLHGRSPDDTPSTASVADTASVHSAGTARRGGALHTIVYPDPADTGCRKAGFALVTVTLVLALTFVELEGDGGTSVGFSIPGVERGTYLQTEKHIPELAFPTNDAQSPAQSEAYAHLSLHNTLSEAEAKKASTNKFNYIYFTAPADDPLALVAPAGVTAAACGEEKLKLEAEAAFREGEGMVWFQHLQRTAGYFFCNYVRANGVKDVATAAGCATCPCGHSYFDIRFADKCHARVTPEAIRAIKKRNDLPFSRKDRADIAKPTSKNTNYIAVEYHTFRQGRAKCREREEASPVPGRFVYLTLLRNPLDRFLSWSSRFDVDRWKEVMNSERRNFFEPAKFYFGLNKGKSPYGRLSAEAIEGGAFQPHNVNAITNTFCPKLRGADPVNCTLSSLRKFNFVLTYDNVADEVNRTLGTALGWDKQSDYLGQLQKRKVLTKGMTKGSRGAKREGSYNNYKTKDQMRPEFLRYIEEGLKSDLEIYYRIQTFQEGRRLLAERCRAQGLL